MRFTPTQRRILAVLEDGMRHKRAELQMCIADELASGAALRYQLCMMRKVLRPRGQDIICELFERTVYYRHIRLLASCDE